MLKNYIKIAIRNLKRHKVYSFINLIGLAVGMAACILILLWVQDELSFDRFHEKADQIYRALEHESISDGRTLTYPLFPPGFGPALEKDYPQVLETVRLRQLRGRIVQVGDISFYEDNFVFADPELFDVFTFPLVRGNKETVLSEPSSIVLTEKAARKYFGDQDPVGQLMKIDSQHEFKVSGIMKDIPQNSELQFDFVVSFSVLEKYGWDMNDWGTFGIRTYVLLNEHTDYMKFNTKINDFLKRYNEDTIMTVSLQPLKKVHLYSSGISASGTSGDIRYVYIFSVIAFFILLMACVNFMNLSTARSENRALEVGIRKVVGAKRQSLIVQFFAESVLLALLALLLAVIIVQLALPFFKSLTGKNISFQIFIQSAFALGLLGIAILTGLLAGSYPAFFLSAFQPIKTLRKRFSSRSGGGLMREGLVLFQFVLTICLVVGTLIINSQMHYIRNTNLGIEKDYVLCLELKGGLEEKYHVLKNEISENGSVISVTAASDSPTGNHMATSLDDWEGRNTDAHYLLHFLSVDDDYLDVFGINLVEGRFFREEEKSGDTMPIVLNQTAVKAMDMQDPIGKRMLNFRIIGVIEDYHFDSLHNSIAPLGLIHTPIDYEMLLVKLQADNLPKTIASLKDTWTRTAVSYPFEYRFLDEEINNLYKNEQKVSKIINTATFLALFIACLGLFGLASYTAEQRTKEIGIRKVFGASIPSIFILLSKQFTRWVMAANIIAWPAAYIVMNEWLQSFAYHTSPNILIFVFAAVIVLTIAMITVSFQTVRAAMTHPIHSLRHE